MSLLDPIIIAQLGNLQLRARRILDGLYAGHHLNRNRGHAQDFSEHRPYNPGDEPRSLDWKVFGRTDRLVIRQYEEQTNVGASVILDHSRSMAFTSAGHLSKLDYAKTMAAALGHVVISQNDAIGLSSVGKNLPLGGQIGHLNRYFEALESLRPEGVFAIKPFVEEDEARQRKRRFVAVFSDLMADTGTIVSAFRFLSGRKNEVMVFQILDPAEIDLPFNGAVEFEDLETGELLKTEPEAIRDEYRAWVKNHLASLSQLFRSAGIEYVALTTDTPFDKGLGAYLSWRGVYL